MFKVLFKWLNNLLRVNNQNWLAQILAGGGIGLATIAGLNIFIDYYKSMALSEFGATWGGKWSFGFSWC